ncbi:hypothetical protein FJ365_05045 [Candidatus Dependentiae bacterium]|nr:hypothetical protein [Candidatus Dependentiae bacterium]
MYAALLLVFLLFLAGCGKRPRSLVPPLPKAAKPSTFDVPRATKLCGTKLGNTIQLAWPPIPDPRLHSYAIYKFEHGRFLRRKPYALVSAPEHAFVDHTPYAHHYKAPCYAIRPCYIINSHICMGALSNVLYFEKDK